MREKRISARSSDGGVAVLISGTIVPEYGAIVKSFSLFLHRLLHRLDRFRRRLGLVFRQDGGQFEGEAGAVAGLAFDQQPAAVLADDLLAHRQAQARAAAFLRGDEGAEEMVHLVGGNAGAVVFDDDPRDRPRRVVFGADRHAARRLVLGHGVDRVGHHVQHRAVDALGIEDQFGHFRGRPPIELHLELGRADVHQLDHVADRLVQVRGRSGPARVPC